jgi:glycerate dehydrogenase
MEVIAFTRDESRVPPGGVSWKSLDELFAESDFISLHSPLTPETENIVNRSNISKMKPSAYILNTGRGQLVDEPALAEALNSGRIAGAGLDVLSTEPPKADNPLLSAKNCFVTPHIAWATKTARERLMQMSADNLKAFVSGSIVNRVN